MHQMSETRYKTGEDTPSLRSSFAPVAASCPDRAPFGEVRASFMHASHAHNSLVSADDLVGRRRRRSFSSLEGASAHLNGVSAVILEERLSSLKRSKLHCDSGRLLRLCGAVQLSCIVQFLVVAIVVAVILIHVVIVILYLIIVVPARGSIELQAFH